MTDGLPPNVLSQRLVSLTYQHRMHSEISAFPRKQFYTPEGEIGEEHLRWLRMYGTEYRSDQDYRLSPVLLGPLERARRLWREHQEGVLLRDASGLNDARDWSYSRYARRALWLEVDPGRSWGGRKNSNGAEARVVKQELQAFIEWASANPRSDDQGRPKPWEVAVLTFYRGPGQYGDGHSGPCSRLDRKYSFMILVEPITGNQQATMCGTYEFEYGASQALLALGSHNNTTARGATWHCRRVVAIRSV